MTTEQSTFWLVLLPQCSSVCQESKICPENYYLTSTAKTGGGKAFSLASSYLLLKLLVINKQDKSGNAIQIEKSVAENHQHIFHFLRIFFTSDSQTQESGVQTQPSVNTVYASHLISQIQPYGFKGKVSCLCNSGLGVVYLCLELSLRFTISLMLF